MCGIVGYVGQRPVQDLLLHGLQQLEYRGYDSAGVSVLASDGDDPLGPRRRQARRTSSTPSRSAQPAVATVERAPRRPASATPAGRRTGASTRRTPTRTSTRPTPSTSWSTASSRTTSRSSTACATWARSSPRETDAEVIAHLIAHHLATGDLVEAVRRAYNELEGHFSFVAMHRDEPDLLVGARRECPLVVGVGDGERFLASAVPAFLEHTRRVQFVENGELVAIRPDETTFMTPDGEPVEREVTELDWDQETAAEGRLRDVHAQGDPRAARRGRRDDRRPHACARPAWTSPASSTRTILRDAKRIVIVACGT